MNYYTLKSDTPQGEFRDVVEASSLDQAKELFRYWLTSMGVVNETSIRLVALN
jgi:hypothetical protein